MLNVSEIKVGDLIRPKEETLRLNYFLLFTFMSLGVRPNSTSVYEVTKVDPCGVNNYTLRFKIPGSTSSRRSEWWNSTRFEKCQVAIDLEFDDDDCI